MQDNYPVVINVSLDDENPKILFLSVEAELKKAEDPREKRAQLGRIFGTLNILAMGLRAKIIDLNKKEPFPNAYQRSVRFFSWYEFDTKELANRFLDALKNAGTGN